MSLRPFNLEEAKAGKPIVCRDGTVPKDWHWFDIQHRWPLRVLHSDGALMAHRLNGELFEHAKDRRDLLMVANKVSGFINIYSCGPACIFHLTKQDADEAAVACADRIACIPIEFEKGEGL